MKLLADSVGVLSWDAYKAFHKKYPRDYSALFVQFDTGEMICVAARFKDTERRHYPEIGVSVIGTTDKTFPKVLTPDGEEIKPAWLGGNLRPMLFDHQTKRVVELRQVETRWDKDQSKSVVVRPPEWLQYVPHRFHGCCTAYWPGPNMNPAGGSIRIERPRKLSEHEQHMIKLGRNAVKARFMMDPAGQQLVGSYMTADVAPFPAQALIDVMGNVHELSRHDRLRIMDHGLTMPVEQVTYPYLKYELVDPHAQQ